jgi:hypothetical protein
MTWVLASSEERSIYGGGPMEVHTVASETRNCIKGSFAHIAITTLHQTNDLRKRTRLDDLGPDII